MKSLQKTLKIIFVIQLLIFQKVALVGQKKNISADELNKITMISSPKFSPDGQNLLYSKSSSDLIQNKWNNSTWVIDKRSKESEKIHLDGWNHQWSKDGQTITYLNQDEKGIVQLFSSKLGSENPTQITKVDKGIEWYAFSPNGKFIAFTQPVPYDYKDNPSYFEVELDNYLSDERPIPIQLFICNSEGNEVKQLTSGKESLSWIGGDPDWSQDNNYITYIIQNSAYRADLLTRKLNIVDIRNGKVKVLHDSSVIQNPLFTKDNKIVFQKQANGLFNSPKHPYLIDLNGNCSESPLWEIDCDIHEKMYLLPDNTIVSSAGEGSKTSIWVGNLDGSHKRLETAGFIPQVEEITVNKLGEIVFAGNTKSSANELYLMSSTLSTPLPLTKENNFIDDFEIGMTEVINWKTQDGFLINGILTLPINYNPNKTYPMIIYLHTKYAAYESFSTISQLGASEGFFVFQPNYRGSYNLGEDFQNAVRNDAVEGPSQDVLSGLQVILSKYKVDENNISIEGHGYGGLVALWLGANYDKWNAIAVYNPITDWIDMNTLTHLNQNYQMPNENSPWTDYNMQSFIDQSPIYKANEIKAPTLIMARNNPYYPITNSYKLFHALKANQVPVKFIRFKGDGYYPSDPLGRNSFFQLLIDWAKEHRT